jgi:arginine utilization protein RocB
MGKQVTGLMLYSISCVNSKIAISYHQSKKLKIMSFQAYIDNIKAKTGKTPDDFKKLAAKKGFIIDGHLNLKTKATEITDWLKDEFDLGHGHAMAIYATFKGKTE